MKTFRELVVWQKAMSFVTEIYKASGSFPKEEMYGLSGQIRRCAVSIPSNIADGFGRGTTANYIRFLLISAGSLFELQTQMEIARNLNFIGSADFQTLHDATREVERLLTALIRKLQSKTL